MKIEIEVDTTEDTIECELCHEKIKTFEAIQLIVKGEFTLKSGFVQSESPAYQHDDCEGDSN